MDGPGDGWEEDVGEPPTPELLWLPEIPIVSLLPSEEFTQVEIPHPVLYRLQRGWQHQTVAFYRVQ